MRGSDAVTAHCTFLSHCGVVRKLKNNEPISKDSEVCSACYREHNPYSYFHIPGFTSQAILRPLQLPKRGPDSLIFYFARGTSSRIRANSSAPCRGAYPYHSFSKTNSWQFPTFPSAQYPICQYYGESHSTVYLTANGCPPCCFVPERRPAANVCGLRASCSAFGDGTIGHGRSWGCLTIGRPCTGISPYTDAFYDILN